MLLKCEKSISTFFRPLWICVEVRSPGEKKTISTKWSASVGCSSPNYLQEFQELTWQTAENKLCKISLHECFLKFIVSPKFHHGFPSAHNLDENSGPPMTWAPAPHVSVEQPGCPFILLASQGLNRGLATTSGEVECYRFEKNSPVEAVKHR